MAKMVKLESLEYREFLDGLGPWGHQGTRVQWEIRDLRARQEFLVHLDHGHHLPILDMSLYPTTIDE